MSHKFLSDANFHELLNQIDQALAEQTKQKKCPYCGGELHQANYPRSPFGLLSLFRQYYEERLSLCCSICRKRTTPPSVRFFGRRWFPAPVFMLINLLSLGVNERRLSQVKHHFGINISESTWKRWRKWWRERFITTLFWQQAKGLVPTVDGSLPKGFWKIFKGAPAEKIRLLLQFLSPLTGGVLRAV